MASQSDAARAGGVKVERDFRQKWKMICRCCFFLIAIRVTMKVSCSSQIFFWEKALINLRDLNLAFSCSVKIIWTQTFLTKFFHQMILFL